jgi:hypothetical protein
MAEYYTFVYCMLHDDGCIIKGRHQYVPEGYVMAHSPVCLHANACTPSDWYVMGVIQSNGNHFEIIEPLRVNYDDYGGGFIFRLFANTLTDEKGNTMENKLLDDWIDAATF